MELLEQIKLLTNKTDDKLIKLLIDRTKVELSTCLRKEYSDKFDNVLADMVIIKLNRLGTEGTSSQSYSGVSESYLDQYPDYIKKQLDALGRKVGFL